MSMHLERGLTTTSTKKRKTKVTKAQQEELERGWRERNQRLKEMYLPKENFEQYLEWVYGKGRKTQGKAENRPSLAPPVSPTHSKIKEGTESIVSQVVRNSNHNPGRWITGPCSSPPSPTYTGTKVIGIAVMHKSNSVPIFSNEEAVEVSSMRR